MPALLIETGFLNTDQDNALYDQKNQEIALAIANAILGTLDLETIEDSEKPAPPVQEPEEEDGAVYYRVQTGAFRIGKTRINCSTSCWIRDIRLFSSMKTDIIRYR